MSITRSLKFIDLLPFYKDVVKKNGPVVHFNLAGKAYVIINDPDDLKIVLSSTQHIQKGTEYDMLRPWLNDGLLLSQGKKWQSRRKLLTNSFHFKSLESYNTSINKHSRVLVKKLLEASANDKEIFVTEFVTLCSLDIICETIMGTEMNSQEGQSIEYVRAIKCACRSVIERIYAFWLWNDLIYRMSSSGRNFFKSIKVLHSFTDNVIENKRMQLKNSKKQIQTDYENEKTKKTSLLDIIFNNMDENSDQMNIRDIKEEIDTFLFEGHDTSSISMSMTLILLGIYPDIQEMARKELHSIFGDSDRDANIEDLNKMKYLDAVIKESLRLYPSVPSISRILKSPLKIKNYSLPPMTTIFILPFIIHRNEELYPNPEEFIPERFLNEDNKSKFLYGYLPFSAGLRNCIGQKYAMNQMKTVISTILRKTKFETLGSIEDIKISMQLLIRMESIPKMKFYAI